MASINPYAEGKDHILFVYDTPMAFQIHFCLTIKVKTTSTSKTKNAQTFIDIFLNKH